MTGCAGYLAASMRATASGSVAGCAEGDSVSSAMARPASQIGLVSIGAYDSVYSLQGMRAWHLTLSNRLLKEQGVRNDSQELSGSAVRRDAGAVDRLGAGC